MSFFIDTNVALGYTVVHDRWHDSINTFIKDNSNMYWSNLVKNEYTTKLDDILDDIDIFLKITLNILKNNQNDFPSYYIFEEHVLKKTKTCKLDDFKKRKILEHFWNNSIDQEGISEIIYLKFRNFNRNFEKMYLKRDKTLNDILILHNCGLNNYLKYLNYATKLHKWGVHSPDCKILTDAHDCALKHGNLIFVTTDEEMLEKIYDKDTSFLNILKFQSCT